MRYVFFPEKRYHLVGAKVLHHWTFIIEWLHSLRGRILLHLSWEQLSVTVFRTLNVTNLGRTGSTCSHMNGTLGRERRVIRAFKQVERRQRRLQHGSDLSIAHWRPLLYQEAVPVWSGTGSTQSRCTSKRNECPK